MHIAKKNDEEKVESNIFFYHISRKKKRKEKEKFKN